MKKLLEAVNGYKTYIFLTLAGVLLVVKHYQLLDDSTVNLLLQLDLLFTGGAVGHKLDKIRNK